MTHAAEAFPAAVFSKVPMNIIILGGGASGMAAALAAAEDPNSRVTVLERHSRAGRKLLATGNGRCNLSNIHVSAEHYHGADPSFVCPALSRFDVPDTLRWFGDLGLLTRTDPDGRIYPASDSAAGVLDVLRLAAEHRGIALRPAFDAVSVRRTDRGFLVTSASGETLRADRLIAACGGAAGAKLGGTRAGYSLLGSLGHTCTPLYPSLVQLKTDNTWTRSLKGIRTQAVVTLEYRGRQLAAARGEVQFTDYGLSGPAVFDLSRAAAFAPQGSEISLQLLPELDPPAVLRYLQDKRRRFPSGTAGNLLTGTLHNTLGRTVVRRAGIAFDTPLHDLSDNDLRRTADLIGRYTAALHGTTGFDAAQVTAGGIRTDSFDARTMESRIVPGLYACGELLDIDGDCGGYNLQWAWSSGRLAGTAAAGLL